MPADIPAAARTLARFALQCDKDSIPPAVWDIARRCVLDLVGSAVAGLCAETADVMRRLASASFAKGPCSVWLRGPRLAPPGAALANSSAASALDLDDGNRAAGGHPGAAIIPAAIAAAEEVGASGRDLLAAVIVGYEVAIRVAAARDFSDLATFSTGRWCAYGVAAAAGRLRKTPPETLTHALAIAGEQSPDLAAAGYSALQGNSIKEGIPWATMTGLAALDLAEGGFAGATDILDHPDYYDTEKICAGLGESFAIQATYFKPYSCCRWIHSALDALCDTMRENQLGPSDIREIQVQTFERALRLGNEADPRTHEGAQYSIPFCLAVAAIEGVEALLPMSRDLLGRPDLVRFARRVRLSVDPDLDPMFPAKAPACVVVETDRGVFRKTVEFPLGDPENPMGLDALERKYERLTERHLPADRRRSLLAAITSLDQGDAGQLVNELR